MFTISLLKRLQSYCEIADWEAHTQAARQQAKSDAQTLADLIREQQGRHKSETPESQNPRELGSLTPSNAELCATIESYIEKE